MNNELDVAALESVGFAENYNNHVLRLFTRKLIVNEKIVDFLPGGVQRRDAVRHP